MGWHWRLKRLSGVVIIAIGLVGTGAATAADALAASGPSQPSTTAQAAADEGSRLRAEIKLLDPYVVVNAAGALELSPPPAVARHVDRRHLATLRNGLAVVNQKIQAGELVTNSGHQLVDPKAVGFNVQWNWTGQVWNWWGMQYYFSEYWTQKIEGLANMGAGASALCAVIAAALGAEPLAIVCGIASGVLWFGAGWLQWADNGGGDVISETWTPFPIGGIWISGQ